MLGVESKEILRRAVEGKARERSISWLLRGFESWWELLHI